MVRKVAADVMTAPVFTIHPDVPVQQIARLFAERHISGVPVVDEDGNLLGMVTEADILLKEVGSGDVPPNLTLFWNMLHGKKLKERIRRFEGTTAGEIMTTHLVTAAPETSVADVARRMAREEVNRIPIVADGKLVGIITRNDVLKVYLRSDDELLSDFLTALRQIDAPSLDPARFAIDVQDGVLRMTGRVERHSDVRLVERLAHAVDGMIGVDSSGLLFEFDDLRH